jgi:hypothetical protein
MPGYRRGQCLRRALGKINEWFRAAAVPRRWRGSPARLMEMGGGRTERSRAPLGEYVESSRIRMDNILIQKGYRGGRVRAGDVRRHLASHHSIQGAGQRDALRGLDQDRWARDDDRDHRGLRRRQDADTKGDRRGAGRRLVEHLVVSTRVTALRGRHRPRKPFGAHCVLSVAPRIGFEPMTFRLGGERSIP